MLFPRLTEQSRSRLMTETFRGYDHRDKILPGQWYDETNMTAAHYPLFAQRARRGIVRTIAQPLGLLARDALMWIDGSTLYYNDYEIRGITLSTDEDMQPKKMVSMGAYVVIFPDKVYVNTVDLTDCGSLDAKYEAPDTYEVTLSMCNVDGEEYENAVVSDAAPEKPTNGMYWVDTSNEVHILKVWSEATAAWGEIATVYVRIEAWGCDQVFEVGDGIELSGLEANENASEAVKTQIADLNATNIIVAKGQNYIVVTGLLDQVHEQTGGLVIRRECPDMDYVCESNNRIWGCKYGFDGEKTVNEIYACKLGDPKNWRCYAGLSTDSYAVSVGTDGKFTGAITHLGYPLFFKENAVHKIFGSTPDSFGVQTTVCRGVQDGAWRSLAIVNEVLYYQSRTDICAYDGSLPVSVSAELGSEHYTDGVAGADGAVYYISMQDGSGVWSMFTYDTDKRLWHREDATRALCFANVRGDLQYINAATRQLISATGRSGAKEGPVKWSATSGIMGYENPYSQYLSRYSIRARLDVGARLTMFIEYDSDGNWIEQGTWTGGDIVRTINIPVVPRRCDHMRLRLSGVGDVKIYSIARYFEGGSDVWR